MGPTNTYGYGPWRVLAPTPATRRYVCLSCLLLLALITAILCHDASGWAADRVWRVALGKGSRYDELIMLHIRLPRLLVALAAGACLALSGALFQTLTRNVLGSPDIIGINTGAAVGIVVTALWWPAPPALGALIGALTAALLVTLGHHRQANATQMIISGIAISAMGAAFIQFGIAQAPLEMAQYLTVLLSGSLANKQWQDVGFILLMLGLCASALWPLARSLNLFSLGPMTATALGAASVPTRVAGLLLAVALAAAAVMVVGPIAFVALAAPQIAKKMTRSTGISLFASALTGAVMLLGADLISLCLPTQRLPAGILTAGIGGLYLLALLASRIRQTS